MKHKGEADLTCGIAYKRSRLLLLNICGISHPETQQGTIPNAGSLHAELSPVLSEHPGMKQ